MAAANFPKDFRDLLTALRKEKCQFVIVGAHAMAFWGYVRATGDLDILVFPSKANGERVYNALRRFGAPLSFVSPSDFATSAMNYQVGLPPVRIDILTQIDGVRIDSAFKKARRAKILGVPCRVLSLEHLIRNKKSTGREKDLFDVDELSRRKHEKK